MTGWQDRARQLRVRRSAVRDTAADAAVRLVLARLGVVEVSGEVDGRQLVSIHITKVRRIADLACGHRVRRGEVAGRVGGEGWLCLDCVIRQLRTPVDGRMVDGGTGERDGAAKSVT